MPSSIRRRLSCTASIAAAVVGTAHAADRLVPAQYPTIAQAVAASQSGDRVLVAGGTYRESVVVSGKNLAIEGIADSAGNLPVLDGGAQSRLLNISNGHYAIRRLRFRNGDATAQSPRDGGAIFASGTGSLTIEWCAFENCVASTSQAQQGGGGAVFASMPATVTESTFRANRAFRGSSLFGVSVVTGCSFDGLLLDPGGELFMNMGGTAQVRDTFLSDGVLYMVNTDAAVSNLWRCGGSTVFFEVAGQLIDGGGNVYVPECDCDANGAPDIRLLAMGQGDARGNGILDACECLADLFVDGAVNGADLSALLSQWGPTTSTEASQRCDINWDGEVNGADLSQLLAQWGPCAP